MTSRISALALDAHDPPALAQFWCQALDYVVTEVDSAGVRIESRSPDLGLIPIDLAQVPDDKVVKNRLHLDLRADHSDQAAEVERLESLGATRVDIGQGPDVSWVVLADPEGNEFCVLSRSVQDVET
ncbi:MAG: VOC family protein [Candidatus Nanopelagicales bacterium]